MSDTKRKRSWSSVVGTSAHSHDVITKCPTPIDFVTFIPWVCLTLTIDCIVKVTRIQSDEYPKNLIQPKVSRVQKSIDREVNLLLGNLDSSYVSSKPLGVLNIVAVYTGDMLHQIKIENNLRIPREVYKVIALTLNFHPNLNSIVINQGLTMAGIYEIRHFLHMSNITEVILDNTHVEAANYYILLDSRTKLRRLSLARCFIQDIGVELIAAKLAYPQPASFTLALLNLSTNRITDDGATYLATALRSNRRLNYLNLTNNMITDKGAKAIFDVLMPFPLSYSELVVRNDRYMKHLRNRPQIIDTFIAKVGSANLKLSKKKVDKIIHSTSSTTLSKAPDMAKKLIYKFNDPFQNAALKDGVLHCKGNNILAYLNLSYNNLSYLILNTILKVLKHQKNPERVPRGLIFVGIDGNPMPIECKELNDISSELDIPIDKKPPQPKTFKVSDLKKG